MPEVKRFDTNSPKPVSSKGLALGNVNASLSPRHRDLVSLFYGVFDINVHYSLGLGKTMV